MQAAIMYKNNPTGCGIRFIRKMGNDQPGLLENKELYNNSEYKYI